MSSVTVPMDQFIEMVETTGTAVKGLERNAELSQKLLVQLENCANSTKKEVWFYRFLVLGLIASILAMVGAKFVTVTIPFMG